MSLGLQALHVPCSVLKKKQNTNVKRSIEIEMHIVEKRGKDGYRMTKGHPKIFHDSIFDVQTIRGSTIVHLEVPKICDNKIFHLWKTRYDNLQLKPWLFLNWRTPEVRLQRDLWGQFLPCGWEGDRFLPQTDLSSCEGQHGEKNTFLFGTLMTVA